MTFSEKELGELLGSVFVGAVKIAWFGLRCGVAFHFVVKYW